MAISLKTAGTWAEFTTDLQTVAIPGSPASGDRMFLWVQWKDQGITLATPANWTLVSGSNFSDGTVATGNGTGSMRQSVYYRDWQTGDANPTLDFSTTTGLLAEAVVMLWQKGAGETWATPIAASAAWPSSAGPQTVTDDVNTEVGSGAVVMAGVAIRDDSATFTRGATDIDGTGITWNGNYVESPATHYSSTTGNDHSGDLGHRFVTTGGTTALQCSVQALSAAETGSIVWIMQELVGTPASPNAGLASVSGTANLAGPSVGAAAGRAQVAAAAYNPSVSVQATAGLAQVSTNIKLLTASDGADGDFFGAATATSDDLSVVVVGAYAHTTTELSDGAAYVYSGTNWATETKLVESVPATGNDFGIDVAASADGSIIAIGSDGTDGDRGAVYIRSGANWATETKITASDRAVNDLFGEHVALSPDGSILVVGAHHEDGAGTNRGAVYVYSGASWSTETKITASDAADDDAFGFDVAISDDGSVVAVSAIFEDGAGTDRGAVYVYSGTGWTTETKLTASDAADSDDFGVSIAISGDGTVIAVGADLEDGAGTDRGALYVYSGTSWATETKLTASDTADSQRFGQGVSVDADASLIVVGSLDTTGGTFPGAVYWFSRTGASTWAQVDKRVPPLLGASDYYMAYPALTPLGTGLVAGAPQYNADGHGAAFILAFPTSTLSSKEVDAGLASVTASALGVSATVDLTAGVATATASSNLPVPSVAPNAEVAPVDAAGYDATVSATSGTDAQAEVAAANAAANLGSTAIEVNAEVAPVTASAYDATVSTATSTDANAGVAPASATANQASASVAPTAEAAAVAVAANQAAPQVGPSAGAASAATANPPAAGVSPNAAAAAAIAAAYDATVIVGNFTDAAAGLASATASAYDATVTTTGVAAPVGPPRHGPPLGAAVVTAPAPRRRRVTRAHAEVATVYAAALGASTTWNDDETAMLLLMEAF